MKPVIVAGMLVAAGAAPCQAQAAFGVTLDNDFFTTFDARTATDHEYTHGTSLWIESPELGLLSRLLPGAFGCSETQSCRHRLILSQEIHTPRSEGVEPLPGERPHAGWLTAKLATRQGTAERSTMVGVQVGVVGPPSLAAETQAAFHSMFGFRTPQGWDHQLPFEPTLQLEVSRLTRAFLAGGSTVAFAGEYDLGADLGTALIQGVGHVTLRACVHVGDCSPMERRGNRRFGLQLSGSIGGRAVLRDMLLDGTIRDSNSVSSRFFVPAVKTGIRVHVTRIGIEYSFNWRGRSYESEPNSFSFGSVQVQYMW